jgi:hypothetical protein
MCIQPQTAYLPGFAPWSDGTAWNETTKQSPVFNFDIHEVALRKPLTHSALTRIQLPYGMAVYFELIWHRNCMCSILDKMALVHYM